MCFPLSRCRAARVPPAAANAQATRVPVRSTQNPTEADLARWGFGSLVYRSAARMRGRSRARLRLHTSNPTTPHPGYHVALFPISTRLSYRDLVGERGGVRHLAMRVVHRHTLTK
jgi:hypothetical protein